MTGRNAPRLVLQTRDRDLLRILDIFRVVDRDQAAVLGPFGSITRANARLLQLTTAGLLTRLTVGTVRGGHKHLYARTRQGAAVVGHPYRIPPWSAHSPIIAGQPLLEHQLRLNGLYLSLYRAARDTGWVIHRWRTFTAPAVPSASAVIPDAYVEIARGDRQRAFFIEVDLATEPLSTWRRKAARYVALAHSGAFAPTFGPPQFGVVVLLPSERRLATVRTTIAGVTSKLFFLTTFDRADNGPLTSATWWRPTGDQPVALFP
jgi:hypothetical protein